jgi:hypothetical protein
VGGGCSYCQHHYQYMDDYLCDTVIFLVFAGGCVWDLLAIC